jgi:hypothetical protein
MEERPSEPLEVFMGALSYACCFNDSKRRWPQPGAIIDRMGEKPRAVLARLKSRDLEKVRKDTLQLFIANEQEERRWVYDEQLRKYGVTLAGQRRKNGEASRLRMAFDLKRRASWRDQLG